MTIQMFAQIPGHVLRRTDISDAAKMLYGTLMMHCLHGDENGERTKKCWPGTETLAQELGWKRQKVDRVMNLLIQKNLVTRNRRRYQSSLLTLLGTEYRMPKKPHSEIKNAENSVSECRNLMSAPVHIEETIEETTPPPRGARAREAKKKPLVLSFPKSPNANIRQMLKSVGFAYDDGDWIAEDNERSRPLWEQHAQYQIAVQDPLSDEQRATYEAEIEAKAKEEGLPRDWYPSVEEWAEKKAKDAEFIRGLEDDAIRRSQHGRTPT